MLENLIPLTEAKAKLNEIARMAEDHDVFLTRHGRAAAVMIGVHRYEALIETIADLEDRLSVYESERSEPDLRIPLDKVKAELGLSASTEGRPARG